MAVRASSNAAAQKRGVLTPHDAQGDTVTLRVRGPTGQSTVTLPAASDVGALLALIAERTGVAVERLELRSGFPPKPLDLQSVARDAPLAALGLATGDSLQAVESAVASGAAASSAQPSSNAAPAAPAAPSAAPDSVLLSDGSGFALQRRIIPSDNACLFSAVAYVLSQTRSGAQELRQVIADAVAADPDKYSEAFLGKPNAEYVRWILLKDSWGGAIELAILSEKFGKEICAADIQTTRVDRYGEGQYAERVFLLYDGLHYDALTLCPFAGAPEELDMTLHPVGSENADALDDALARLVAAANKAKAFTDTQGFTLRCIVCREGVKGQAAAAEHAKRTGHTNFGEYA